MELGGGGVSWGVQSRHTSGHMGMCIFPNKLFRIKVLCIVKMLHILSILIICLRPGIESDERFFDTPVWASAGYAPQLHISAMSKEKEVAEAMRAKARAVRHDGSYGGVFEMCVWCTMKKRHIILGVGVTMIDVVSQFGSKLKKYTPFCTHKMVAGKMINKKLMSATKPNTTVPDVNHFVSARSKVKRQGLTKATGASAGFLPDGSRRSAASVAEEWAWRLEVTNEDGDDLMDCFANFQMMPGTAVSWKKIRNDIADEIDKIAKMVEVKTATAWVDCFKVCEENATARALVSSPIHPDALPEFNIQVRTDVAEVCEGNASSSSSGYEPIAAKAPAAGANSCPVLAADAPIDAEAKTPSGPIGNKRRKLPPSFGATGSAGASAGPIGDKGALAGSSGDKGASAGAKSKQAGVGKNRKAKVEAYVSKSSVGGAEPNPDDALAPRGPEDGVVPDLSTALAAAKRAVAMAAVDAANASSDAPVRFEQWVISLPKKEQENITESYLHYTAAQEAWKREMGQDGGKGRKTQNKTTMTAACKKRIQRRGCIKQTAVADRMSCARDYIAFLAAGTAQGEVACKLRAPTSKAEFIRAKLWTPDERVSADVKCLNAARNILNRGLRELRAFGGATDVDSCGALAEMLDGGRRGRKRKSEADKNTPQYLMSSLRGRKGARHHAMILREALYEWFIDIKSACLTSISPHFMLRQARHMATICLQEMAKNGRFVTMPIIDARWLRRWLDHYRIVLRQPNRRYKVSRAVGDARCVAEWTNVFKVRRLAWHFLGNDLSRKMMQVDEKPVHMNESGSKAVKTLEFEGAPSVALRTNHSASRERVTIMTSAFSCWKLALATRKPPIAACIKAKSKARASAVNLPAYTNMSLDWTASASYDRVHFLAYLRCWLVPWTAARASAGDYRILFLDVAACHLGPEIAAYCWECGYVLLYHYGGTTSVMQVPDTHIHQPFSKLFLELEQRRFTERQEFNPGCVSRTLQEVLDDVVTVWRAMDHQRGVDGHWETGVACALDSTEDGWITGEALEVWKRQGMVVVRQQAIDDVDARVAAKELTSFADVHKVIKDPPEKGEYRYGEELEGEFPEKGEHWASARDAAVLKQEREDLAALSSCIDASPLADVLIEKEASRIHAKIKELVSIQNQAASAGIPGCAFIIRRRVNDLERRKKCLEKGTDRKIEAILQSKLRVDQMAHHNVRDAARKLFAKNKAARNRARFRAAATKKRLFLWKKEKKDRVEEMMRCGSTYTLQELGEGPKNDKSYYATARAKCLQQVWLRAPKLPLPVENNWLAYKFAFAKECNRFWGVSTGTKFLQKVNLLIASLGIHYHGHEEVKAKLTPQAKAWLAIHCKSTDNPRAFEDFVVGLGVWMPKSMLNCPTG